VWWCRRREGAVPLSASSGRLDPQRRHRLPLGNATPAAGGLDARLAQSDVVTLHVPQTPETTGMIGAREIGRMRKGIKGTLRTRILY